MTEPSDLPTSPLVDAWKQAHIDAAAHVQHHGKEHRNAEKVEFLEFLEGEAVESVRRLLGDHIAELNPSEPIKGMFDKMLDPEHPIELLAELIPILWAIGYQIGAAALAGPTQALTTVSLRNFGDVYPDPLTGAAAAARNRITPGEAQRWADNNGMRNVDLQILMDISKNSLPAEAAMLARRNGRITDDEFDAFLIRDGYDLESINVFKRLLVQRPSATDAIRGYVEGQLSRTDAEAIWLENGMEPESFEWQYQTAGQSPGVVELNKLWNYGLIDETLYEQGLIESPIKNKYVDVLKASRFHRPPMRVTLSMVKQGVITPEQGDKYLAYLGFFPEDRAVLIADALKAKSAGLKELTVANLRGMYAEGLIDRATAEARIVEHGFDQADATLMIDYADAVRKRQRTNLAVSHVRSLFVSHKIDEPTAIGALDSLQIPTTHRDELIHDWEIEHAITTKHLTLTDLVKGYHAHIYNENDIYSRLIAQGYAESDAHAYMQIHGIPTADIAKLKDLTQAQLLKMMGEERIPESVAKSRMQNQGLAPADAQLLIDSKLGRNADGTDPAPPTTTPGA